MLLKAFLPCSWRRTLREDAGARINEVLQGEGIANISFQGGEPALAGLGYFRHFTETMNRYPGIRTVYSLQTNGTLIDEEWADFFHENHFLIGISIDGYQTNMDRCRFCVW